MFTSALHGRSTLGAPATRGWLARLGVLALRGGFRRSLRLVRACRPRPSRIAYVRHRRRRAAFAVRALARASFGASDALLQKLHQVEDLRRARLLLLTVRLGQHPRLAPLDLLLDPCEP